MRFDFEMAWLKLVQPLYEALEASTKDLLKFVEEHAAGCQQNSNLDAVWPTNKQHKKHIQTEMNKLLEKEELGYAAHLIHCYGHWLPSNLFMPGKQVTLPFAGKDIRHLGTPYQPKHGAHWKFANYADQLLRKKFNITKNFNQSGFGCLVYDGGLRVCYCAASI
jgi:hypothetical protein